MVLNVIIAQIFIITPPPPPFVSCPQVLPDPLWVRWFYGLTLGQLHEVPGDGLVNILWAVAAMENATANDATSTPGNCTMLYVISISIKQVQNERLKADTNK